MRALLLAAALVAGGCTGASAPPGSPEAIERATMQAARKACRRHMLHRSPQILWIDGADSWTWCNAYARRAATGAPLPPLP